MKFLTVEEFEDMIETVIEMFSLWIIVSHVMATMTYFSLKPASLLMTRPQKRHESDLQFRLK